MNPSPMTGLGTNSYLIGHGDLIVLDPGPLDDRHLESIVRLAGGSIRYVIVTHHHEDHAGGARRLADLTDSPLLGPRRSERFVPDAVLHEGDIVAVPGARLAVLATPGHSSDHLGYVLDELDCGPVLFSGDTVLGGSTSVVAPPSGDMEDYFATLRRLIVRVPRFRVIAPGHGPIIEGAPAALADYLAHRLGREADVVAALATLGPSDCTTLARSVYSDVDSGLLRASTLQVWAHLRKLGAEGRAFTADPADPRSIWRAP